MMSDPSQDELWMARALAEAELAMEHGDVPVGCIVIDADGSELGRSHNRREVDRDPVAHAEVLALRTASQRRNHWRLEGTTVYSTLEPCPMCAGALVNSRVSRLVFAASDPKAGAVVSLYSITTDPRLNHRLEVQGGVLAQPAVALLQRFFAGLRCRGAGTP
jgi:tRNA(adenine34) deaminase